MNCINELITRVKGISKYPMMISVLQQLIADSYEKYGLGIYAIHMQYSNLNPQLFIQNKHHVISMLCSCGFVFMVTREQSKQLVPTFYGYLCSIYQLIWFSLRMIKVNDQLVAVATITLVPKINICKYYLNSTIFHYV